MKKLLTILFFAAGLLNASAQTYTFDPDFPVFESNDVTSVVEDNVNGILYVGGAFNYAGPNEPFGAQVDASTGIPDFTFLNPNGAVRVVVPDGAGGWYIGGDFTKVGNVARNYIAQINSSGNVTAWDPGAFHSTGTPTVRALAVSGTTVYVGGFFESIGGQSRTHIAALDATVNTNNATAWNPVASQQVNALVVSGTTVYAGGSFSSIGGQSRSRIAALNAAVNTNMANAWNPNANADVNALAISGTTVYAGGSFTNIGGQTRNRIAALDAATGAATTWDPNANSAVSALALSGSTVYAGGAFLGIGGQTRNRIAALDATTGAATAWDPNANGVVNALAISGTTVYAGGSFTTIGGQTRSRLVALDATLSTNNATSWNSGGAGLNVYTIAVSGSKVYVGGAFHSIGGQIRTSLAAINTATKTITSWNPAVTGSVYTLALSGSTVYAGGSFTVIGGQSRNNIAALDASTGNATTWNPNASGGAIYALVVSGTTIYAGGAFTFIGGQTRNRIAALNNSTGSATTWNPNAGNEVHALAVSGSVVYAGGYFTTIGGQTRNYIAALDATTGSATAWDPNASGPTSPNIKTLAVSGTTVYAGGRFTGIGGQTRNYIAALDANTNTNNATSWNPNADQQVVGIAVSGSTVYAGGNFANIGGQSRSSFAALDATTGNATTWNHNGITGFAGGADGGPRLAASGSKLYVCAGFSGTNGEQAERFTLFNITDPGTSITTSAITGSPFCAGANVSVAYTATGTFNAGNVFTAQLSNASGDFTSPTDIGTVTSTTSGTIAAVIPTGAATGTGYRIRVKSNNPAVTGSDNGANLTINAIVVPSVSIAITSGTNPSCNGNSITFTATPVNGGVSPSYVWKVNTTTVQTGSSATYSTTSLNNGQAVSCILTSNATCASPATATSNSITMTIHLRPSVIINGVYVCRGGTVQIGGTSIATGGTAPYTYLWSPAAALNNAAISNPLCTPTVSDVYTVSVWDTYGCLSYATATVNVNEPPAVNAGPDATIIPGGSVVIGGSPTASGGSGSGYVYVWSPGTALSGTGVANPTASPTGTTTYHVTVTDANLCTGTDDVTVSVANMTISGNAFDAICAGASNGYINITVSGGTVPYNYHWNTSATTQNVSGLGAGIYSVTVTDNASGTASASFIVGTIIPTLKPSTPGTITGTTPICPLTTYTYSIAPVANAGTYIWTIPATNCTILGGQGTTSLTVQFATAYTTGAITVKASNCIGTSAAKSLTVTKLAKPATPGVITGTLPVCLRDTIIFSIAPVANATSYAWTAPANTAIVSGQGTTTVAVSFQDGYVTSLLSVTASNCGGTSAAKTLSMTKAATPLTPGAITGSIAVCPAVTYTYSIAAVANTTSYIWTVPASATLVGGQGTNVITVTYPNGYTSSTLSVVASNCGGNSPAKSITVAPASVAPATPGVITGAVAVCPGIYYYSIAAVANAITYNWTPPANASVTGGQGTTTVQLTVAPGFTTGNLTVTAGNCVGTSAAKVLALKTVPSAPAAITGPVSDVCLSTTGKVYSIVAVPGASSYNWVVTVTGGAAATFTGQGTNSITVDFPATFTSAIVKVQEITSCSSAGAFKSVTVIQKAATPGAITGTTPVCPTMPYSYSIAPVPNAISYTWTVPTDWVITNGGITIPLEVTAGTLAGRVTVTATNACGTGAASIKNITISTSCRLGNSEGDEAMEIEEVRPLSNSKLNVKIYPNPANGSKVSIELEGINNMAQIRILNVLGQEIMPRQVVANGINTMDINSLENGIYMIEISENGSLKTERLVISK